MVTIEKFEDIISRQKGQILVLETYKLLKDSRDFSFRDQIQRCAISIPNNIAEGFERKSNNEFRYFLFVAKGSCGEYRSMLYLANKLNYISKEKFEELYSISIEISKLLTSLIGTLSKK